MHDLMSYITEERMRWWSVTASAIEKVHDDYEYDIRQVQIWIETAKKLLRE